MGLLALKKTSMSQTDFLYGTLHKQQQQQQLIVVTRQLQIRCIRMGQFWLRASNQGLGDCLLSFRKHLRMLHTNRGKAAVEQEFNILRTNVQSSISSEPMFDVESKI